MENSSPLPLTGIGEPSYLSCGTELVLLLNITRGGLLQLQGVCTYVAKLCDSSKTDSTIEECKFMWWHNWLSVLPFLYVTVADFPMLPTP